MAQKQYNMDLTKLLLESLGQADPMLHMLEWLCGAMMEAEVTQQVGAYKNTIDPNRTTYRSGYRPRRLDTHMGTVYADGAQGAKWGLRALLRDGAKP